MMNDILQYPLLYVYVLLVPNICEIAKQLYRNILDGRNCHYFSQCSLVKVVDYRKN